MSAEERIAQLEAENAAHREQVAELAAQVQGLQARLAKDSHNSSKPPSSDGLARKGAKTKSLRRRSGRKPGGQLGHRGATLRLVATPDECVEHRPAACVHCHTPLPTDAPVVGRERRQVHDLPPLRLVVTEHQALHVRCPQCEHISIGAFPAEAPSRAQYGPRLRALAVYLVGQQFIPYARVRQLCAEVIAIPVSTGTVVQWLQRAADVLEPVERQIRTALRQADVLHDDETGVRQAGQLAWAHVASTARLTHYAIHPQRGHEATDAIGILPGYRGVSVHDGWAAYQHYTACHHALCNIHHLRELTFLEEEYHQGWAADCKHLLQQMRAATDQARQHGQRRLDAGTRAALVARYDALVAAGLASNRPPATCSPGCCWTKRQCWPFSTISRSPSTTTRRSTMCAA